jgi:hypothetical protein
LRRKLDPRENGGMSRLRRFYVLCHADLDEGVVVNLIRKAVYCGPKVPWRGDRQVEIPRHNHLLFLEARSGEHAVQRARCFVSEAGGGEPELTRVGSEIGV